MKRISIILGLIFLSTQALWATISVDGFCYLENATDYSGTKVLFNAVSASAVTDSTFTNTDGSFLIGIEEGIYTVHYSHDGWQPYTIPGEIPLFLDTTLADVTLSSGLVIEVSGPQSGIWSSYNLYQVIGDISVANGDSLIIEPGVTVKFMDYYSFTIYGKLFAAGTENDTILFSSGQPSTNPGDWNQIKFESGSDSNSIISYSKIEYAKYGIHCRNYSSPSISNNTISYNNNNGIYCHSSSTTISNNTICNNNSSGIFCYSSSATISNNTISNNNSSGIYCNFSDPTISSNTISNNNEYGIHCCNYSSPSISNNTISNSTDGIRCISPSSPTILNNIIYDNLTGINAGSSPSALEYNLFRLNNTAGTGSGIPSYFGQIVMVNANGDSCDTYYNLFMDPLLVNPDSLDFHLTENSPCIDAGNPDPIYYDPDGTISDIGAYYFDQLPYFPNADFSANITNGIFPLIVDFTDLSTMGLMGYPIIEWFWDFNNDGIVDSNEQNPQWSYTEAGLYTVKLTVCDVDLQLFGLSGCCAVEHNVPVGEGIMPELPEWKEISPF